MSRTEIAQGLTEGGGAMSPAKVDMMRLARTGVEMRIDFII